MMKLVQKNLDSRRVVFEIQGLKPDSIYELILKTFGSTDDMVLFKTLPAKETNSSTSIADPIECIIVIFILIAWMVIFAVFVHKWGTIRIVQHAQYRPEAEPKNLKNIKVVKKQTESVIYRSHSQKFNRTLRAREKKIERMNTMPNMCINYNASQKLISKQNIFCTMDIISDHKNSKDILKKKLPAHARSLQGKPAFRSFGTFPSAHYICNAQVATSGKLHDQKRFTAANSMSKYISEPSLQSIV